MVDNGEPSVRGEWHLTEGATRQRRGATSPRSSPGIFPPGGGGLRVVRLLVPHTPPRSDASH